MKQVVLQLTRGYILPLRTSFPVIVSKPKVSRGSRKNPMLCGKDMGKKYKVKKIQQGEILLADMEKKSFLQRLVQPKEQWRSVQGLDTRRLAVGTVFTPIGYQGAHLQFSIMN